MRGLIYFQLKRYNKTIIFVLSINI